MPNGNATPTDQPTSTQTPPQSKIDEITTIINDSSKDDSTKVSEIKAVLERTSGGKRRRRTNKRKGRKGKKSRKY
jgi:hypothetical protein